MLTGKRVGCCLLLALTLFRLWLCQDAGWLIVPDSIYDDDLMVRLGRSLERFEWLGDYTKFTLAKSAAYPFFLALGHWLHIPYGIWLGLFLVLSAWTAARAMRPLLKSGLAEALAYLFLLYQPIGFVIFTALRVYRNALSAWAALLVFACFLALWLRREQPLRSLYGWLAGTSLSLAFFWHLREDSAWMLPFVLMATAFLAVSALRRLSGRERLAHLAAYCLPLAFLLLSVLGVRTANYACYGVFLECDRTQGELPAVGSLLMDIEDGADPRSPVWVSREALGQACQASPTLAALPGLNEDWDLWAKTWAPEEEVTGDIFYWALRDALERGGFFRGDAAATQEVCGRIAAELRQGFEEGTLRHREGGWHLSSQHRPLYAEDFLETAGPAFRMFLAMGAQNACELVPPWTAWSDPQRVESWNRMLRMDFREPQAEEWPPFGAAARISCIIILTGQALGGPVLALLPLALLALLWSAASRRSAEALGLLLILLGIFAAAYADVWAVYLFSQWLPADIFGDYAVSLCFYASAGYTALALCECLAAGCLVQLLRGGVVSLEERNLHV